MTEKAKIKAKKLELEGLRIWKGYTGNGKYELKGEVKFNGKNFKIELQFDKTLCYEILKLIPEQIRQAKSLLAEKLDDYILQEKELAKTE